MITFGPVPSRRLGWSLGINHVPPKTCTYSCVYCQVGRTTRLRIRRTGFLSAEAIVAAVTARLEAAGRVGASIDYLSFVPDGEPTLDEALGRQIRALRRLGIPIAVITNGSLLDRADVRDALQGADWVSLKVDAVHEKEWNRVNRPHGRLRLERILEGMREFAAGFRGRLVTETMLLAALNDAEADARSVASFIGALQPATSYLAVPTRPPAERWVRPAAVEAVTRAYEIFRAIAGPTELLVGYEGDAFAATGDPGADLLAITAVHPMREQAVERFLQRAGAPAGLAWELVRQGLLAQVAYGGHRYFVRPTTSRSGPVVRRSDRGRG
jgi:wyosine [tRNA(Phe)-imidazoG37] synthetase (radical SAM superfamily)